MQKHKLTEAVVVEGTYDAIRLSGFLDAVIIKTNGFSVFRDKNKIETIKTLAKKTGIVILTDSDSAGFKIRNFVKQSIQDGKVLHAYIPDIYGKEKRKAEPSKEGLLGVEGIDNETILNALKKAGCEIDSKAPVFENERKIQKSDLYLLGLSGGEESVKKRAALCKIIGIPSKISANMLTDVLNRLMSFEQAKELIEKIEFWGKKSILTKTIPKTDLL